MGDLKIEKETEMIFDGPETTRHVQRIRLLTLTCNVCVNEAFNFSVAAVVGVTCNRRRNSLTVMC
jgi:hypothetical protein